MRKTYFVSDAWFIPLHPPALISLSSAERIRDKLMQTFGRHYYVINLETLLEKTE